MSLQASFLVHSYCNRGWPMDFTGKLYVVHRWNRLRMKDRAALKSGVKLIGCGASQSVRALLKLFSWICRTMYMFRKSLVISPTA